MLFNRRGQSTAEYAILLGLVIGALVVMQSYMKRGLQGRIRDASDINVNNISSDANWVTILNSQPTAITQSSDAHWEFDQYGAQRTRDVVAGTQSTESMATGGAVTRDITEVTAQAAGDYQKYGYNMTSSE